RGGGGDWAPFCAVGRGCGGKTRLGGAFAGHHSDGSRVGRSYIFDSSRDRPRKPRSLAMDGRLPAKRAASAHLGNSSPVAWQSYRTVVASPSERSARLRGSV